MATSTYTFSGISEGSAYKFVVTINWDTGETTIEAIEGSASFNGFFFDTGNGGDPEFTLTPQVNMKGSGDGTTGWDVGVLLDNNGQPFPYSVDAEGPAGPADISEDEEFYTSVNFNIYDFKFVDANGDEIPDPEAYFKEILSSGGTIDLGIRASTVNGDGSIKDSSDDVPRMSLDKYVYSITDNGDDCEDLSGINPIDPAVDSVDDVITYRVGVANTGDTALTEVTIADAFLQYAIDIDEDTDGTQIAADLDFDGVYGEIGEVLTVQGTGDGSYVEIGTLAVGSDPVYIQYAVEAGDVFTFNGDSDEFGLLGSITNIAIADSKETEPKDDDAVVDVYDCKEEAPKPELSIDKIVVAITDDEDYCEDLSFNADTAAEDLPEAIAVDSAADEITYQVTVTNTGVVGIISGYVEDDKFAFAIDEGAEDGTQVLVTYTDPFGNVTGPVYATVYEYQPDPEDPIRYRIDLGELGYSEDESAVPSTAVITYRVLATEEQILDGSNIDNIAYAEGLAADGQKTLEVSDDATVDVDVCPDLELIKTAVISDGAADEAGDIVTYTLTLTNLGNSNLTNVVVTDAMFAKAEAGTIKIDGVAASLNADGTLTITAIAFGAAPIAITFDYALTQDDINNSVKPCEEEGEEECCIESVPFINTASATPAETEEDTTNNEDEASFNIDYNPSISLVKSADKTYVTKAGDTIGYTVTIANTGNVDLNGVDVVDNFLQYAVDVDSDSTGVQINADLNGDGIFAETERLTVQGEGDTAYVTVADLDVGKTVALKYSYVVTTDAVETVLETMNGDDFYINTATATADEVTLECEEVTATDTEVVDLLIGPGVRTPGFWQKWTAVWDGNTSNDDTFNKKANFPGIDVLTGARSGSTANLIIGDWDASGAIDNGENGFVWTINAAKTVLNASTKLQQDVRYVLGRDVVATWLNYLAGNSVCQDDLQAGINWLESRGANGGSSQSYAPATTPFSGASIKASSSAWTSSGNEIHKELDYFNNTGICDGVQLAVYGGGF